MAAPARIWRSDAEQGLQPRHGEAPDLAVQAVGQDASAGLFAGLRAALGTGDAEANRAALGRVSDWNAVAALARRHRVISLMLRGLRRAGAAWPEAEAALGPSRTAWNFRGLVQLSDLRAAAGCLDSREIPFLVLKGMPLSTRLFGAPLERQNYDIDLLVPPAAAKAAADALRLNGWQMKTPSFAPTPARDRYFEKYVKDRVFTRSGGVLELHHRLANNPYLLSAPFEDLHTRAAAVAAGGLSFLTLGDDDLLVYLCVHGQLHRWSRLKWQCDVAALIGSMQEDGLKAAVEHGASQGLMPGPVFGTVLRLCKEVLHMELPEFAASLASGTWTERQGRRTRILWDKRGGGRGLQGVARLLDQMRTAVAIRPSRRVAAHELARLATFPYQLGRLNLPDRLFFLYPPLLPVLWLSGRIGRVKADTGGRAGIGDAADLRGAPTERPGRTASVPRGALVYAVGDIHGRVEPLIELLESIRRDASRQQADRRVLVFLGDYVDRGPQSRQVIELLRSDPAPEFETVFLKGNHEAWLLGFLNDASLGESWLAAGGHATLLSYGVAPPSGTLASEKWEVLRKAFAAEFPEEHKAFLSSLARAHVEGDYAFTHAGIRPGTPHEQQREEDLLWGSEDFIGDGRDHGKVIVHGHWYAAEPVVRPNRIGIDTGAFATGRLTCLALSGADRRFLST